MKKLLAAACLIFAFAPAAFSIEPTQWQYRQPFEVAQSGPLRISVPLETLGCAQPDLRDLRIIGPAGTELPYTILEVPTERPLRKDLVMLKSRAIDATMEGNKMVILIDSGTNLPIDSVRFYIADTTDYTKPARVEVSNDKENWTLVAKGAPLFRRGDPRGEQYAFVQDSVPLGARTERYIRVTISNQGPNDAPIAIGNAFIFAVDEIAARAGIPDEDTPVKITQVEQGTNGTTLTLDLSVPNVSLSQLHFDIADTLFMRNVSVHSTPLDGETVKGELADQITLQVLGGGTIYCIKDIDGTPMKSNTTLEFDGFPVSTRTIWVGISNHDSPPLHILGVTAKRRPVLIAFNPPAAGRYTLLSGNAQAASPRYDLAAFSQNLGRLPVTQIAASPIEPTPDYRAPKPPPSGEPLNLATRALFWVALALVVVLLLVVVAKLLPKPKE